MQRPRQSASASIVRARARRQRQLRPNVPTLAFRLVIAILSVFISPAVLLVSLFRPRMKTGRRWLIAALAFTMILAGAAWSAAMWLDRTLADSLSVLADYETARVEVRDMPFYQVLNAESLRNGVDPSLVAAIVQHGSGFRADFMSRRGARGLMQITPSTWAEFMPSAVCRGDHAPPACSGDCIFSPAANLRVGTVYLRYLVDQHGGDIMAALRAYNSETPAASALSQTYAETTAQAWTTIRGQNTQPRVDAALTAMRLRSYMSWGVIAMLCLILAWSVVRLPDPRRDDDGASDHGDIGPVGNSVGHRGAAYVASESDEAHEADEVVPQPDIGQP